MEDSSKDVDKIMERVDTNHSGNIDYMGKYLKKIINEN